MSALVREAGLCVMRRHRQRLGGAQELRGAQITTKLDDSDLFIRQEHFEEALSRVKPSVSLDDRVSYENLRKQLASELNIDATKP